MATIRQFDPELADSVLIVQDTLNDVLVLGPHQLVISQREQIAEDPAPVGYGF